MKSRLVLLGSLVFIAIAGCKNTIGGSNWVGTYTSTTTIDSINQVVVTQYGTNIIDLQLQAHYGDSLFTFATLERVPVQTPTTITINNERTVGGYKGQFQFTGTGMLTGDSLILSGTATSVDSGGPVIPFQFTGTK